MPAPLGQGCGQLLLFELRRFDRSALREMLLRWGGSEFGSRVILHLFRGIFTGISLLCRFFVAYRLIVLQNG